ncbi:MAG TPA: acyl-homoserine-lactone synthase [Allosphingosinicella sp.]|jgi:acyl-homoserine lactone synthase
MILVVERPSRPLGNPTLRSMFEARKRVFVDLLKWDVPVLQGRYEIDQFDDPNAVYIIVTDRDGGHLGSARLLQTMRPHILGTLFPRLCAGDPPRGSGILEITRFCLDRSQGGAQRIATRNRLVSALVDYALDRGVTSYVGVAEMAWLQQVLAFGWACRPLGAPLVVDGRLLGALRIEIEPNTPALLSWNGIYAPHSLAPNRELEPA